MNKIIIFLLFCSSQLVSQSNITRTEYNEVVEFINGSNHALNFLKVLFETYEEKIFYPNKKVQNEVFLKSTLLTENRFGSTVYCDEDISSFEFLNIAIEKQYYPQLITNKLIEIQEIERSLNDISLELSELIHINESELEARFVHALFEEFSFLFNYHNKLNDELYKLLTIDIFFQDVDPFHFEVDKILGRILAFTLEEEFEEGLEEIVDLNNFIYEFYESTSSSILLENLPNVLHKTESMVEFYETLMQKTPSKEEYLDHGIFIYNKICRNYINCVGNGITSQLNSLNKKVNPKRYFLLKEYPLILELESK